MTTFQDIAQTSVQTWVGSFLAIGFMIPLAIASLAGGFILASFALGRLQKTTLGIYLRHWFARYSPTKFFPEDMADERLIVETVRKAIASGKLKDLVRG